MLACLLFCLGLQTPALENAGFEASDVLAGWKTWIYKDGQDPLLRADTSVFKEGQQSLLIEAHDPADVAVGQTVALPAASVWRARCWIKTENLVARDRTDVGAALHIQTAAGGTLARGESRFGTTDWRETQVVFRVPPGGEAKIALFYIGYGKGTGKVWFDGVRLEQLAGDGPQTVEIDLTKRGPAPIDVKQGGQFIESLCDVIPSMIAQQVAGDSFEEEPPWRVTFRSQIDKPYRPWYPSGAVHVANYSFDTQNPFNGQRSQKIELPVAHARAGLSQDGFCVQAGVGYRLCLHMRGEGDVSVFASVHGDGTTIAGPAPLGKAGKDWQRAEAVLNANRTTDHATLTIEFAGPGTLWLDRVYLIGDDAVLGIWRPDVVTALKALNPGVIRFGGSTVEIAGQGVHEFNWQECVGPWDRRTPFPVMYWGGLDANFASLEEIVQLCRHIGAEPLLCVRWTGRTPADAAAEVEYFNGGPDTAMGKRRVGNGHPQPYGVKYWQIGNEVGGEEYNRSLAAFAKAMKQADASIKVITSGTWPDLRQLEPGLIDYTSEHHYGCEDLVGMQAAFEALRAEAARLSGQSVRVAITEWNTTAGDFGLKRGALLTLGNALACSRYHHVLQRNADLVEITNRSNLADSFCSGIIQTGPGWMYFTPTYYAQQLYARSAGSYPLPVSAGNGVPWPVQEPDISATVGADARTLRVYAVNSLATPREVTFRLSPGSTPARAVKKASVYTLKDRDGALTPEVVNTRDDATRIATTIRPADFSGTAFRHAFEPFSVTMLELELGE